MREIVIISPCAQFVNGDPFLAMDNRRVAERCPYQIRLQVTGAVTKGADWADRGGSTQFSNLVDPARSHSQAAKASAAAKIETTAANRKLVKFHKDICSQ